MRAIKRPGLSGFLKENQRMVTVNLHPTTLAFRVTAFANERNASPPSTAQSRNGRHSSDEPLPPAPKELACRDSLPVRGQKAQTQSSPATKAQRSSADASQSPVGAEQR